MFDIPAELRRAVRRLRRSPGFTLPAVATLALGLGAVTAVFTVVHAVLLSPLPYPSADRLVWVDHGAIGLDVSRGLEMAEGIYLHYRRQSRTLEELALYSEAEANLTGDDRPERVETALATPSLFHVLRVRPFVGRVFSESDATVGAPAVVLLSYPLWSRRYGRALGIVGRIITIDGNAVEVIGVMPVGFSFPSTETELWLPLIVDPARTGIGGFTRRGVARLAPGASVADAQAELQRLIPGLIGAFPGSSAESVVNQAGLRARVVPLLDEIAGESRRPLWLVLATAALVLLIACVNVANLLLVRSETRERDTAVRTALGASRSRMVRHYLTESVLLAGAGVLLGLGLAVAGVGMIRALGSQSLPRLHEVGLGPPALVFISGLAGALVAALTALPALRRAPVAAASLREGGRAATVGRRRVRLRHGLVIGQVALALVLLSGAGLMLRTYGEMRALDPGLRPKGLLTFEVGLPAADYPDRESAVAFHRELLDRLRALPAVVSAGAVTCLPLCGSWAGNLVRVDGRPARADELPPVVATRRVSAGYLETMGTPLLAGRTLERSDAERRTGAAVINAAMAEAYWPDEDPLGRRFYHALDVDEPAWYTVVGVVEDTPIRDLTESPARIMYLPLLHVDGTQGPSPRRLSYAVRTAVAPLSLAGSVRDAVWSLDSDLPVARVRTMENIVAGASARTEFTMVVLLIAALTALLLGAVGLYGVVSYVVSRRAREIGVRMALGAEPGRIRRMVLTQGLLMAVLGIACGLGIALPLSRTMEALLYGIAPTDLATYLAVSALLLTTVIGATWLPAWRAARIDPATTLRGE
jgi:predicted permease